MKKLLITFLSVLMLVACAIGIAACGKVEFKLSFIVDGEVYASIDTSGDEVITMPDEPKKEDYIFDGWYWDKDTWQRPFTANSLLNEPISSDMSVYAKWLEEDITKRSYTVTFNSFGGSAVSDATVQYGKLLTEPSEPTRPGYVFVAWYKEADLKTEWDFTVDTVTEDITLYAKWVDESDATGCDILSADGFEVDGNTLSVKVPNAQEHFALSETITVSPYAEWTVTSDITGNAEIPSATVPLVVGDNTYYINVVSGNGSNKKQYTVEIRRRDIYTVTYSFGNGSADVTEQVEEDGKAPFKSAVKTGYTFDCWKNDSSAWDFENDVISGDTTLTASWSANTYDVIFNSNGGDTITASTATYDVAFEFTVPVRNGYTFSGWKTEGGTKLTDSTGKSIGVWNIAADTTLYADWSATEYSVVYNNMDGATNSNPAKYTVEDDTITLANAEKTGYTFLGWYTDSSLTSEIKQIDTGAAVNVELWAKWEAVEYTATFKDGNTVVDEIKFTVETDSITAPAVPTHTGYTGVWEGYTLGTEDITVNAVYTAIEYTATFKDGNTVVDEIKFTVETDSITAPAVPTHTGYTGVWESYTLGTENITINAVYTVIEYTATFKAGDTIVDTIKFTVETDSITAPAVPTHKGYTGVWESYTLGAEDIVINAIYSKVDYTISYHNVTGANNTNPSGYNVETLPIVLEDATKRGYTFLGWYTEPTFENKVSEIVEGTTGNINLYAKWEIIEYTATFKDGNTVVQEIVFTVETDSINAPAVPVHTGYTGVWESYTLGTENITIDAIYTAIEYTATFKEGSKVVGTVKFTVETDSITEPTVPNHVGYTGVWESYSLGAQNITIDAVYTAVEYTATFKDGDTIVDEIIFTVETESINEPNVPAHTGYTGKWEEYTLGTQNITINAIYELVPYGIIYHNTTGATHSNPTGYDVEDQPIILKDASKTGYKFVGWYTEATFENKVTEIEIGTAETLNLYAKWEAIEYTITYLYDADLGYFADDIVVKVTYTIEDAFDFASLLCKKEGYTFDGWFTEKNIGTGKKVNGVSKGTMGDISVYAHFGLKEYTITYNNVNGATNTNPTNYTVESEDISIYPLSQKGYTFDGWYVNEDCTVAANTIIANGSTGDIVLYAKWTPIVYTIEYVTFGGTAVGNPSTYTITDNITFKDATLSGYVFKGWYTAADGGVKTTCITAGTTGNIVLYAHWDYVSTITFETNGGSSVMPIINVEGTSITAPASPTKEHYEFDGWYSDSALTNAYSFTTQPSEDITLYAKWTPVSYEIQYVLNGGVNSKDNVSRYTIEDTVTLYDPSKVGYTFIGWFTDAQFTSAVVTEIQEGTSGKITLYAHYSINQYTISFESNGGTNVSAITQNYASNVVAPESPSKNGYVFVGWYSNASLTSKYTFSTMPAQNITLYAKWQKVTYTITYNLDGGRNSTSNPSSYTITSNTITFAEPTKNGYTFDGWYTDSKYTTPITEITSGSYGDVEIFAKWVINTYTIIYHMPEGATHSNIVQYTIESDIYSLLDAALVGHTFVGWYSDSNYTNEITVVAGGEVGNLELYAKFTANTYNVWLDGTEEASIDVSFNLNGASGSIATQTITETKTLVYPTIPSRSGYVFAGWYDNIDCVGNLFDFSKQLTNDTTLYAKWIKCESAIGLSVGTTTNITLDGINEQRYMFVPLVSGNVTISTTGAVDTYGAIYDSTGTLLRRDDDNGTENNFQIIYNVTAGQVYYIGVRGYSSSVTGTVPLIISGATTPSAGGFVVTANRVQVVYGESFELPIPNSRDGYKFLGWMDVNGVLYADQNGTSIKVWDKAEDSLLVSKWEAAVYTVTFVTNGGNSIDPITLDYGARLDLNLYIPVRSGYTFSGWYLSASDTEAYNSSTMPDSNITLYAKWTTFTLGTIKYNEDKTAIKVNDVISPELFNAICVDTNGNLASFTVTVSGTQAAGETITIRLTATSGGKTKVVTITDVKVYGNPTLTVGNGDKDYINMSDTLNAELFNAVAKDSFGEDADITVSIEGDYAPGHIVTVVITATDPASNQVVSRLPNIKIYGTPTITVNNEGVQANKEITIESIGASAVDSFGQNQTVTLDKVSYGFINGDVYTYNTTTSYNNKYFTAMNSETYTLYYKNGASGDRTYISVYCVTTGTTVKSNGYYTNYSSYSSFSFNVVAGYQYYIRTYAYSSSYKTTFSMYLESSSNTVSITDAVQVYLSTTDAHGNSSSIVKNIKVYNAPTISDATKTDFKMSDTITVENLGITSTDVYGKPLTVSISLKSGVQSAGNTVIYTATATDIAGNTVTKDITVKIYGVPNIMVNRTDIKANETVTIESFEAVATDSFGDELTMSFEILNGSQVGGTTMTFLIVATDKAGNVCELTQTVKVYDANEINLTYMNMASDLIKLSSKGEEFFAQATDSFGNTCDITIEAASGYTLKGGNTISLYIVATDNAGNEKKSELITNIKVYDIPTITFNRTDNYVTVDEDLELLFIAKDSFGEEIYAETSYTGTIQERNTIVVSVTATDNAGNIATASYELTVLSDNYPAYATLYVDGDVYGEQFVDSTYQLPVINDPRIFIGWADESGKLYTGADGKFIDEYWGHIELHAKFEYAQSQVIYDAEDLQNISMSGRYVLAGELDLGGIEWTPLGTFTGDFNGNGYSISNFTINLTYDGAISGALFKVNKGTIRNLGVIDFEVYVNSTAPRNSANAGGLVAENYGTLRNCFAEGTVTAYGNNGASAGLLAADQTSSGVIVDCHSSGSVIISADAYGNGGGLVGNADGTISNCYSIGTVSVKVTGAHTTSVYTARAGGLVGFLGFGGSKLSNCYSACTVEATAQQSPYAGGLLGGVNGSGAIVENCYATGNVTATSTWTSTLLVEEFNVYAGGLAGYFAGTVTNSYASGNVTVSAKSSVAYVRAGGLIAKLSTDSTVTNCFAVGNVTATSTNTASTAYAGGLVGTTDGTITNSYRNSSQTVSCEEEITIGTTQTLSTMKTTSFYTNTLAWSTDVWNIVSGKYPTLK